MKRNFLTLALLAILCASCGTEYVVTDSVRRNLGGTRTILSTDTTSLANTSCNAWDRQLLDRPLSVDFRVLTDTMRYAYRAPMTRDGWTLADDSLSRLLRPQVTVTKNFRWFTTRYRYTARFAQLDSLPVPIAEYFTSDEAQLFLGHSEWPADWNGADMYALLDNLNTKYVQWWSHCFFEKEYELYLANIDSAQRALLEQYHDTLLSLILADLDEDTQQSLTEKARRFPELTFANDHSLNLQVQADIMSWYDANCELEHRVLWRVELPGGRTAEHMVSTERLATGDYTVEFHADVLNWWAVALTLLVALALVLWLPRRRDIR